MDAINNNGNINSIIPQIVNDVAPGKTKDVQKGNYNGEGIPVDRVEISRQAKELSKAAIALNSIKDVRTELIAKAVQERVTLDNRIPANLLAQKMLFQDIKWY